MFLFSTVVDFGNATTVASTLLTAGSPLLQDFLPYIEGVGSIILIIVLVKVAISMLHK